MEASSVFQKLKSRFGDWILEFVEGNGDPYVVAESRHIVDISRYLKEDDDLLFDSLICLSAVDGDESYSVVYHLHSLRLRHRFVIKAYVSKGDPVIPSVEPVWKSADWHEREAYDLMGIRFEGHPDLRRLLLPDDWPGHPLRKDYVFPEEYDGIPCVRE